ncbi:MAG: VIT domain-containing protein [bacterium]|nr:VIT domain-containing protein [bacterium]
MPTPLARPHTPLLRLGGQTALPLRSVRLAGRLLGRFARMELTQVFAPSPQGVALEAIYTFPLPTDSAVLDVSVSVNGRAIEGRVFEREEAHRRYTDAVERGQKAALLEEERPEVFNLSLGNLDATHPTTVQLTLLVPLEPADGFLRWRIPTMVAPRYMGGGRAGDRTMDGHAEPTPSVPDADRISPPVAFEPGYELAFDLVVPDRPGLEVKSPSHRVSCKRGEGGIHVGFRDALEPLDRDLVLELAGLPGQGLAWVDTEVVAGQGTFTALVVPDLAGHLEGPRQPIEVVFLLDRSGSMGGDPIVEARRALQLSLRQLRAGDRFSVIAFDNDLETLAPEPLTYGPDTLARADAWISRIEAHGGTDLDKALERAFALSPGGIVVLLTDAQVGHEDTMLDLIRKHRDQGGIHRQARIHAFGIGHNVVQGLLTRMARLTGGDAVDIVPGEAIEDRVVTQFASLLAPRLLDPWIRFEGITVEDLVPSRLPAIVDGQPVSLTGRFTGRGPARMVVMGQGPSGPTTLSLDLELAQGGTATGLDRLWARQTVQEGLADLDDRQPWDRGDVRIVGCTGCNGDGWPEPPTRGWNRQRLTALALEHQVLTPLTSWAFVDAEGPVDGNRQPVSVHVPVAIPFRQPQEDIPDQMIWRQASANTLACSFRVADDPRSRSHEMLLSFMSPPEADSMPDQSTLYGLNAAFEPAAPMSAPRQRRSRRKSGPDLGQVLLAQQAHGLWGSPERGDWTPTLEALEAIATADPDEARKAQGALTRAAESVIDLLSAGQPSDRDTVLGLVAALVALVNGRQARLLGTLGARWLGLDDPDTLLETACGRFGIAPTDEPGAIAAALCTRLMGSQR